MLECYVRRILAIAMVLSLFLEADPDVGTNWAYILGYSMEFPTCMPIYVAIPILAFFNLFLGKDPKTGWKTGYRVYLLLVTPAVWPVTLGLDLRSVGFWAHPVLVSIAALLEIVFAIKESKSRGR